MAKALKYAREDDYIEEFKCPNPRCGKSYGEIAGLMNRPRLSCAHRISRLAAKGKVELRKIQLPWRKEEDNIMLRMESEGYSDEEIAYELGRDGGNVSGHRRNLRNKGLYKGYKQIEKREAAQS
jgi:hypothetical protein